MGISSTANRIAYTGNAVTTSFSFPYYFAAQTDLVVYLYDTVAGGMTLKVLATNYTISGTPNAQGLYSNGGSVVFSVAPATTDKVVITRVPSFVQSYALLQNGTISSAALVNQMDYLTLLVQRLTDLAGRSIVLPDGYQPAFVTTLPTLFGKAGYAVCVNGTGDGMTLTSLASVAGITALTGDVTASGTGSVAASISGLARSKLASGTASHVLINDGAGVMSSEAQLAITRGGTGQATAAAAINALVPSQAANSGKYLTTNGTVVSWSSVSGSSITVTGTRGAPTAITAVGGITPTGGTTEEIQFIQGSGGAITVTANPQVAVGTVVGQKLKLKGRSDTNTVTLANGTGLSLNGNIVMGDDDELNLWWDGTNWTEMSRSR